MRARTYISRPQIASISTRGNNCIRRQCSAESARPRKNKEMIEHNRNARNKQKVQWTSVHRTRSFIRASFAMVTAGFAITSVTNRYIRACHVRVSLMSAGSPSCRSR